VLLVVDVFAQRVLLAINLALLIVGEIAAVRLAVRFPYWTLAINPAAIIVTNILFTAVSPSIPANAFARLEFRWTALKSPHVNGV
jgi:hypothetical protein